MIYLVAVRRDSSDLEKCYLLRKQVFCKHRFSKISHYLYRELMNRISTLLSSKNELYTRLSVT